MKHRLSILYERSCHRDLIPRWDRISALIDQPGQAGDGEVGIIGYLFDDGQACRLMKGTGEGETMEIVSFVVTDLCSILLLDDEVSLIFMNGRVRNYEFLEAAGAWVEVD
jgi:hypothetical protein